ncbi:RIKEN cDNA 2610205E22, isoform CRA_b [Mus musculus]|nr:RIKEN cDNA 2610205E22, isoform CRA_b [Mus musculus]EDL08488.1 RIKEN cDNA 2610205E22, isoform CRA_b [Mus musculus]
MSFLPPSLIPELCALPDTYGRIQVQEANPVRHIRNCKALGQLAGRMARNSDLQPVCPGTSDCGTFWWH